MDFFTLGHMAVSILYPRWKFRWREDQANFLKKCCNGKTRNRGNLFEKYFEGKRCNRGIWFEKYSNDKTRNVGIFSEKYSNGKTRHRGNLFNKYFNGKSRNVEIFFRNLRVVEKIFASTKTFRDEQTNEQTTVSQKFPSVASGFNPLISYSQLNLFRPGVRWQRFLDCWRQLFLKW